MEGKQTGRDPRYSVILRWLAVTLNHGHDPVSLLSSKNSLGFREDPNRKNRGRLLPLLKRDHVPVTYAPRGVYTLAK
jgi:hypothetical protein